MQRHPGLMLIAVAVIAFSMMVSPSNAAPVAKSGKKDQSSAERPLAAVADKPGLPRVLLIGDSISIGYTLPVRELLKDKANVHRPSVNCGPTERGVANLEKWLGTNKWDVIHFNFGLHDLKYIDDKGATATPETGKHMVETANYEANLRTIVARLKRTGARLIWCNTTPVPADSPGRVKDAELEYNQIAAKVMKENGVAKHDLHGFVAPRQNEIQLPKNVHFTKEGYEALGKQVAKAIEAQLGR